MKMNMYPCAGVKSVVSPATSTVKSVERNTWRGPVLRSVDNSTLGALALKSADNRVPNGFDIPPAETKTPNNSAPESCGQEPSVAPDAAAMLAYLKDKYKNIHFSVLSSISGGSIDSMAAVERVWAM